MLFLALMLFLNYLNFRLIHLSGFHRDSFPLDSSLNIQLFFWSNCNILNDIHSINLMRKCVDYNISNLPLSHQSITGLFGTWFQRKSVWFIVIQSIYEWTKKYIKYIHFAALLACLLDLEDVRNGTTWNWSQIRPNERVWFGEHCKIRAKVKTVHI